MAEVALAVVLVVGAGLLVRSFQKLMTVDPGFNKERLTTFGLVLPGASYPKGDSRVAFFNRLMERLRQLPGVTGVAAMTGLPPNREVNANDVDFEGYMPTQGQPQENVDYFQTVSLDYLKTVRDVKQGGMSKTTGTELYFLNDQGPRVAGFAPGNMNVVVRSTLPEDTIARQIRQAVREQDAALPIVKLRTMDQVFSDSAARPRFLAELLAIFAGLALALAAIGTYGILSYSVTERTKEIGIHMALGATRGSVLGMVLGQGMRLTIVGLVAGLAASFGLTRLLQAQLFNVKPTDPATLTAVAVFIAMIAFVACYVPARRATRVDPMVTLRES
jgi:hypothetical protein